MDSGRRLVSSAPLPGSLLEAAKEVARDLGLPDNCLNNGPSSDEGGLFQLGLPQGIVDRLNERVYGPCLTVFFFGRLDQIQFKLYAAADRRRRHSSRRSSVAETDRGGARGRRALGDDAQRVAGIQNDPEGYAEADWA